MGSLGPAEVVPGVARLGVGFVNVYMVGSPGGPWTLVDTGLPRSGGLVRLAVERLYGRGARPEAIVLTHGHFDHAGPVVELAEGWDVPVYAHALELPYLTGRSDYPPQDPTMGGAIAQMSRLFPHGGRDLGDRVLPLPEDGRVPGAENWTWVHTPGHTHGHVSLFREADGTLLAGDALATMDLDSWTAQILRGRELHRPPVPFTTDWEAARRSVEHLATLEPSAIAAGHGLPITGPGTAEDLKDFSRRLSPPPEGRYAGSPARANEEGVRELPPPVPDPLPRVTAGVLAAAGAATIAAVALRSGRSGRRRRRRR